MSESNNLGLLLPLVAASSVTMRILKLILPGLLLLQVAAAQTNHRVPHKIKPIHYKLELNADPEKPTFNGTVTITLDMGREQTNEILIHASSKYITVTKIMYNKLAVCDFVPSNNITDVMAVACINNLVTGRTITIEYVGKFSVDEMYGFYKSTYDNNQVLVATQFQPVHARKAFPCFDEPFFKASFDITITHPTAYSVLANMPIVNFTKTAGDKTITTFQTTPVMSSYLVAFVISHFEPALQTKGKYNVYARNSAKANMEIAKNYGEELVDLMSDWTEIDYEELGNPQINQIAIPDFAAGAMENWGLITFREVDLLDEGNRTSDFDRQRIISVMAHEISHQWFGDYVTLDWWSNTWLNEGFATYFQYHLANLVDDGTMELDKQFVTGILQSVLEDDSLSASLPLSSPEKDINSQVEINNKFDEISYSKGACIVRMMKFVLGENVFRKGLNSYLQKNKYKNTNPEMLLKSLQNATGGAVANFPEKMHNWIYSSGFPLLTVTQKDPSTVTITQERYGVKNETQWYVPLSYTNSKEKSFAVNIIGWLEPNKSYDIPHSKSDWIILNVLQSGFYRVNYDDHLWENIIAALKGKDMQSIHPLNRAQLIDDTFAIARTGRIGYDKAFRLVQYLKNEKEYYPWSSALDAFKYLIYKVDAETRKMLNSMILDLLNSAFPHGTNYTTHIDKLKEETILEWACKLGQSECLNFSKKAFQEFKSTGSVPASNKRETVFCYGLKTSANVREDYKFLFEVFQKSTSSNEQNVILGSLGCIEDKDILMEYLKLTITENSTIRQQDFATVFSSVYTKSKVGVDVALSFLENNFKKIEASYSGVNDLSMLATGLANKITTGEQTKKIDKIIKDHQDTEQIKIIGKRVMDLTAGNEAWKLVYGSKIKQVLEDLKGSSKRWHPNTTIIAVSITVLLLNFFY